MGMASRSVTSSWWATIPTRRSKWRWQCDLRNAAVRGFAEDDIRHLLYICVLCWGQAHVLGVQDRQLSVCRQPSPWQCAMVLMACKPIGLENNLAIYCMRAHWLRAQWDCISDTGRWGA